MKTILITGATGFLGSHIAEEFVKKGYKVVAIKRTTSSLSNCKSFENKVEWVNSDIPDWKNIVIELKPEFFIHAAWLGVGAKERDDYTIQTRNINFLADILDIAKKVSAKYFIGLGSQAEYGLFSGKIAETQPINPNSAYGVTKHLSSVLVEKFCNNHNIAWCWLRLFSFFGEREADNWFIPTVIHKLILGETLDMTLGLQKYAYMYVKDLANYLITLTENSDIQNGIYNLSSKKAHTLKDIVEKLIRISNCSETAKINFGKIPYRDNQPMLVEGDIEKLEQKIGILQETDFDKNLETTYLFYKEKFSNAV